MASFTTVPEALSAYERWLACQPPSSHTRRTYLTQVNRYGTYLSTLRWEYGHPLQEPHARDYAVRDYKPARQGGMQSQIAISCISHQPYMLISTAMESIV